MQPSHEALDILDKSFPIRVFLNSSAEHHIFVHPHWHEEIEILYVVEGNAMQQINDTIFPIVKGDVVVIGSNDIHATYTKNQGRHDILVLQHGEGLIKTVDIISPEKTWINDFLYNMEFSCSIPVSREDRIVNLIFDIQQELMGKNPAYQVFVKAKLYEIIGLLTRDYRQYARRRSNSKEMDKSREMLQNTFDLIDKRFTETLTLEMAAKSSNLSVSHFCRLFKRYTSMTFKEYLTVYRINKAEETLSDNKTITEIAFACGFNSIDSFIRAFKRYKECTPSAYRKCYKSACNGSQKA